MNAEALDVLEHKVGPLPVGGYVLLGVGGMAGAWFLYRKAHGGPSTTTSSTTTTGQGAPLASGAGALSDSSLTMMSLAESVNSLTGAINSAQQAAAAQTPPVAMQPPITAGGAPGGATQGGTPPPTTAAPPPVASQPPPTAAPAAPAPPHPAQRTYTVQRGDSLWAIAQRLYGNGARWTQLYNMNRHVIGNNPNLIYAGQVYSY